jgi:hypothetical protein
MAGVHFVTNNIVSKTKINSWYIYIYIFHLLEDIDT